MPLEDVEVSREIRHRQMVGVLVFDAQSTSDVDVPRAYPHQFHLADAIVHPVAQRHEITHLEYLRADVKMQAAELQMREFQGKADGVFQLGMVYAELVLRKPGGDVGVSVGAYVRIDPDADERNGIHLRRQLLDDAHFRSGFHVEAAYARLQAEADFIVPLAHSGEDYRLRSESGIERGAYLSPADAIGPQARLRYDLQQSGVGIGLDGIMHPPVGTVGQLPLHLLQGGAQQGRIVEVERSAPAAEEFYGKISFDHRPKRFLLSARRVSALSSSRTRMEML